MTRTVLVPRVWLPQLTEPLAEVTLPIVPLFKLAAAVVSLTDPLKRTPVVALKPLVPLPVN
ncbi:MAG: hypothetical protein ABI352_07795 [Candidatus Dormibacter sp.]